MIIIAIVVVVIKGRVITISLPPKFTTVTSLNYYSRPPVC